MTLRIYPSLISSDLLNLQKTITQLNPYCPGYHLDVMDNHFVPNLTWGPAFINAIAKAAPDKSMWVHIMVDNPEAWPQLLTLPENSILSFHIESIKNFLDLINNIHAKKWRASIAISPKTPIAEIFDALNMIDQVLVMSVIPGFSGQQFIQDTLVKLQQLVEHRSKNNLKFSIGIDGGVNAQNISQLAQLGVDEFAAAACIFHQSNPVEALHELNQKLL